jgi:hypothetical protein
MPEGLAGHNILNNDMRLHRKLHPDHVALVVVVFDLRFRERGLEHLLIGGDGSNLASTIERLEQFSSEVMSKFA